MKPDSIKIDSADAQTLKGMKYVIVRSDRAGVFAGYLESRNGDEVVLRESRRLWKWFGASLSELAMSGTSDASKCKFPEKVGRHTILTVIEVLECTEKGQNSIDKVPVWKA